MESVWLQGVAIAEHSQRWCVLLFRTVLHPSVQTAPIHQIFMISLERDARMEPFSGTRKLSEEKLLILTTARVAAPPPPTSTTPTPRASAATVLQNSEQLAYGNRNSSTSAKKEESRKVFASKSAKELVAQPSMEYIQINSTL